MGRASQSDKHPSLDSVRKRDESRERLTPEGEPRRRGMDVVALLQRSRHRRSRDRHDARERRSLERDDDEAPEDAVRVRVEACDAAVERLGEGRRDEDVGEGGGPEPQAVGGWIEGGQVRSSPGWGGGPMEGEGVEGEGKGKGRDARFSREVRNRRLPPGREDEPHGAEERRAGQRQEHERRRRGVEREPRWSRRHERRRAPHEEGLAACTREAAEEGEDVGLRGTGEELFCGAFLRDWRAARGRERVSGGGQEGTKRAERAHRPCRRVPRLP